MSSNPTSWFHDQLDKTADFFIWGIEQVPLDRLYLQPEPPMLGEWPAVRHAFHLVHYEKVFALPSMRLWLGDPPPDSAGAHNEERVWGQGHELAGVIQEFRKVRAEQIALLNQFRDEDWDHPLDTYWGRQTLHWILSKTLQHTAEHVHDVLSIALFWDHLLGR